MANLSPNGISVNPRKRLAELVLVLTPWFRKWTAAFPTHPVSELQLATYAEALDDLSLDEIEVGCKEATRTAEQFPKPGHIRKALEARSRETICLGPKLLDYPPISQEERDEALKFSEMLKKNLGAPTVAKAKRPITVRPSLLSIDEQKKALRAKGYL